jgi:hypothetical protein
MGDGFNGAHGSITAGAQAMAARSQCSRALDFEVIARDRRAITPLSSPTRVSSSYSTSSRLAVIAWPPHTQFTNGCANCDLITAGPSNHETLGALCSRVGNARDAASFEKTRDCGVLACTGGAYGL